MATIPPERAPKPGLNIYGCAALNPVKLTIAAEELGIPYNYICMDLGAGESKTDWYASINPNGLMPAIVHVKEDGTSTSIFESAACLLYIASEFDKEHKLSYPIGMSKYWTQVSWLSWQVATYGPVMIEAIHYNRFATEPAPYGIWRTASECRRLNHVLDKQLSATPFVAGDRLTVADVAIFVFAYSGCWCGVDIDRYPYVKAWRDKLARRPGFRAGMQIPVPFQFGDDAVSNPDGQDFYRMVRKGGGQMIKAASDQWPGDVVAVPSDHANYV